MLELEAKTHLEVATREGAAKTTLAAAELQANTYLLQARTIDLVDEQLNVYASLATNKAVMLSDSNDREVNMMLLADSVLGEHAGHGESDQSMVAKLNMLKLAGHAYGLRSDTYVPPGGNAMDGRPPIL